jgi:class 3 adenylate cyclase
LSDNRHVTYEYANLIEDGLATLRGQILDTEVYALAVWDARPGDGPGGTDSFVTHFRSQGRPVEIIDLREIAATSGLNITGAANVSRRRAAAPTLSIPQHVMAMLFADVVGYTRLQEEQIPNFVTGFMAQIGDLVDAARPAPVMRNTWGDAIYLVFNDVAAAFHLAMDLRDMVIETDWQQRGLPQGLSLRIGLHAGPVFKIIDPVVKKRNYTGSHVSRTARIEPITPPGQVYASQAFAALASAKAVKGFACQYVGVIPQAKKYGDLPTYHVRRV